MSGPQFHVAPKRNEKSELRAFFRQLPPESANRPESSEKRREGLKRLISYMFMGIDVSSLFPDVVLASATNDILQKKLVSIYLNNYAEQHPETALLVVNAYQKDLLNSDPRIRGMAIRALTSMNVDSVEEYAHSAVRDGLQDTSAQVRCLATIGVSKLAHQELNANMIEAVESCIASMVEAAELSSTRTSAMDLHLLITSILVLVDVKGGSFKLPKEVIICLFNSLDNASWFQKVYALHTLKNYTPESEDELLGLLETVESFLSSTYPSVVISSVICMLAFVKNFYAAQSMSDWAESPAAISVMTRASHSLVTLLSHSCVLEFAKQLCFFHPRYCDVLCNEWVAFIPSYCDSQEQKLAKLEILSLFRRETQILETIPHVMSIHVETPRIQLAITEVYKAIVSTTCMCARESKQHDLQEQQSLLVDHMTADSGTLSSKEQTEYPRESVCESVFSQLQTWYWLEIPSLMTSILPLLYELFLTHPTLRQWYVTLFANLSRSIASLPIDALLTLTKIATLNPLNINTLLIVETFLNRVKTSLSQNARYLVPFLTHTLRLFVTFPSAVKDTFYEALQLVRQQHAARYILPFTQIEEKLSELPVDVVDRYLVVARLIGKDQDILARLKDLWTKQLSHTACSVIKPRRITFEELDASASAHASLPFGADYGRTGDGGSGVDIAASGADVADPRLSGQVEDTNVHAHDTGEDMILL